ncbi:MAG: hypothetical protein VSS75_000560 [Candidatus Parabeggiatoa sp.]|nr:hypothetical protein [Candidatus Parabeggiatoa sp.]
MTLGSANIIAAVLLSFQCEFLDTFPLISCEILETEKNSGSSYNQTEDSYAKLAACLCNDFKWCADATTQAIVEKELRHLETEPDKIESIFNDLKDEQTEVWPVLVTFVDNPLVSAQAYLEDITDFDKTNLNQIVGEQRKLRHAFESFQDVTLLSFDTAPDSAEYPVLSFVYQVNQKFSKMSEKTTLQEENRLPFFRNNDVERVKFLKSVIKSGQSKKLIDDGRILLFDALCQLSDKERVEALYDRENRIKKLCIVPNKNYPTQRQCERLKTEVQKKQAQAFLDLREKLLSLLSCKDSNDNQTR